MVDLQDSIIALSGPYSIVGRSIVVSSSQSLPPSSPPPHQKKNKTDAGLLSQVHALADDLGLGGDAGSLSTGNAGSRLACGVIAEFPRELLPQAVERRGGRSPCEESYETLCGDVHFRNVCSAVPS